MCFLCAKFCSPKFKCSISHLQGVLKNQKKIFFASHNKTRNYVNFEQYFSMYLYFTFMIRKMAKFHLTNNCLLTLYSPYFNKVLCSPFIVLICVALFHGYGFFFTKPVNDMNAIMLRHNRKWFCHQLFK